MNAYEGVGTLVVFQFRQRADVTPIPQNFANVYYDGVTTENGILEFENTEGTIFHVPNVAFYTVDPRLG